jgi:hypothetical protein
MSLLDATSFEDGYPTSEKLVCSAVNEGVLTGVQHAFHTQFHMELPSRLSI